MKSKKHKRIIDGDTLIVDNPVNGSRHIDFSLIGKEGIIVYNIDEMPIVDIKKVKIIGKIRGEKKDIELSMSKKIFFDWIDKLGEDK